MPDVPLLDPKTQFRQLYDQEFQSVYRSIRAVVLDSAAAEDLTQETFVRAYRARHRYTPTAPPGAWPPQPLLTSTHSRLSRVLAAWAPVGGLGVTSTFRPAITKVAFTH